LSALDKPFPMCFLLSGEKLIREAGQKATSLPHSAW